MTRFRLSSHRSSLKLPLLVLATLVLALTVFTTTPAARALADNPWTGVDFAWHGKLEPQAFKKAGVDFVVRYLAGGTGSSKEITHHEADMWSRAGIGIVLVWETTASRAGRGYGAGYTDASKAFPQAASMGMPDGKPVYFAVDFDASGPQVEPYFKGIYDWARTHFADGKATSRIGVYGGHDVIKYIHDRGYAAYKWQALAWMHGKGWQPDAMHQWAVGRSVGGVEVDLNRVYTADYGVWFSTCVINPPKKTGPQKPAEEAAEGQASKPETGKPHAGDPQAGKPDAKAGHPRAGDATSIGKVRRPHLPPQALEQAGVDVFYV